MQRKSLKKNAVLGGIKQVCAIIFPLITFPYISQVLTSEGFGIYSFSYSVISYFLLIAAYGISTYCIREASKIRDDKEAINRFASQLFSINIFSVLISYVLLACVLFFSKSLHPYFVYIITLSLIMPLSAIGLDWVNNVYEDFSYITLRYIIFQIVALIFMFVFVRESSDVLRYCLITVFASSFGNILNLFYIRKYVKIRFTFKIDIKKHIVPLTVLFINSIAVLIYVSSDITILGVYYDDETVGIYGFASKIYNILKQLVNAVVVVAIPRVAYTIKNQKESYEYYLNKILWMLCLVLFPIVAGMIGMGDTIIKVVGGDEYISGSGALRILSVALVFAIFSSMYTNCVLIVNNKEKICLYATVVSALTNIVLNVIILPFTGLWGAAVTTVIAEGINCLVQFVYSFKVFRFSRKALVPIVISFCSSILVLGICILNNYLIDNCLLRLVITILMSCILYFLIHLIAGHPLVKNLIRRKM